MARRTQHEHRADYLHVFPSIDTEDEALHKKNQKLNCAAAKVILLHAFSTKVSLFFHKFNVKIFKAFGFFGNGKRLPMEFVHITL